MADMNLELARHNMVEQQIRPWDVLDSEVLDLITHSPREDFVQSHYRNLAFTDMELPIGHGEMMMSPKVEARMLQALEVKSSDRVLEVGTGSGFVTLLLAKLATHVFSVEIHEELSRSAQQRLADHDVQNVTLEVADAANGWEKHQPYDVIAITGSLPNLPQSFLESMQVGGRLFAVVGNAPVMEAKLIRRLNANEWTEEVLFETVVAPLQKTRPLRHFEF